MLLGSERFDFEYTIWMLCLVTCKKKQKNMHRPPTAAQAQFLTEDNFNTTAYLSIIL